MLKCWNVEMLKCYVWNWLKISRIFSEYSTLLLRRPTLRYVTDLLKSILNRIGKKATFEYCLKIRKQKLDWIGFWTELNRIESDRMDWIGNKNFFFWIESDWIESDLNRTEPDWNLNLKSEIANAWKLTEIKSEYKFNYSKIVEAENWQICYVWKLLKISKIVWKL